MLICTMSARSMLDTLGFGSFLDRIVYDRFRNNIILDCDMSSTITCYIIYYKEEMKNDFMG